MRKAFLFMLLGLLFLTNAPAVCAEEPPLDVSAVEEALTEEAREVGGTLTLDGSYDGAGALSRLWRQLLDKLREAVQECASPAATLLAIAFLSALAAGIAPEPKTAELIHTAAAAAAALSMIAGIDSLASRALEAIEQLADYSRAALPAVFTAAAATGSVLTASARYAAVCLSLDVLMAVTKRLTLPLIYSFFAVSISGGVFPHPFLRAAGKLLKRLATMVMTGLTTAFTAYIGVTGLVTGSADAAAVKTAKSVISGALPVVGGILSDAASAVLSAASLIKNSAGAFALVSVCALCAAPFALLSIRMLLFQVAAAVAEAVPGGRLAALLGDLSAGMAMLLGLVGSFGVMLFFSVLAAIKVAAA